MYPNYFPLLQLSSVSPGSPGWKIRVWKLLDFFCQPSLLFSYLESFCQKYLYFYIVKLNNLYILTWNFYCEESNAPLAGRWAEVQCSHAQSQGELASLISGNEYGPAVGAKYTAERTRLPWPYLSGKKQGGSPQFRGTSLPGAVFSIWIPLGSWE